MKFFIFSADANGIIDSIVRDILRHFPTTKNYDEADVVLIPMTRIVGYKFNHGLEKLNKPWVLVDFCEYGANDWDRKQTHMFGLNTYDYVHFQDNPEWHKFDDWFLSNRPKVVFKRELLEKDMFVREPGSTSIYPVEYTCRIEPIPVETREQFNARPIETFHYWGRSHESRPRLHAETFLRSGEFNYEVVDSIANFSGCFRDIPPGGRKVWGTMLVPHFARIDLNQVLGWNIKSKLGVSLPGAGVVCFRHAEVSAVSVMVMQEDTLAWAFPWIHGVNCIKVPIGDDMDSICGGKSCPEFPALIDALKRDDLYDIYSKGLKNIDHYRTQKYIDSYMIPIIQKHL